MKKVLLSRPEGEWKDGALIVAAVELDATAMRLDRPGRNRQSETATSLRSRMGFIHPKRS